MKKPIVIIAGEPNSISSEIIFKSWKSRNKYNYRPLIIIGSIWLLQCQKKKLNYKIPIKEIKSNFNSENLGGNQLLVIDVKYKQKNPFEKISIKSNKYIFNCFKVAINLIENKKIEGFINCPVSKETLFKGRNLGITEFLAKKSGVSNREVMLIYNKKLSVSPLTTHVPLNQVNKRITQSNIVKKLKTINNFFRKKLNRNPKIAVLGLNPHSYSPSKKSEEKKIILPAIKTVKKLKINAIGPLSPDTSFMIYKLKKIDVIFGMYHDQVLTSFKALFRYNAFNITLGLPYTRISPDHGVAESIVGKNIANPESLIESIKFFNYIK